jgi:hypothetical protein
MKTIAKQQNLFETLSSEEAANVNGAWGRHYYFHPCSTPVWHSGWHGGWHGGSQASNSSVTQTTNVNILIED